MIRRNRRGRFEASRRWEQIVGFSILGGIFLAAILDYSRPIVVVNEAQAKEVSLYPREVLVGANIEWNKERIERQIRTASEKYGVSYEQMYQTIKCESGFDIDVKSNYHGEESYGLAQFHLPSRNRTSDGTLITYEMAVDPVTALDAMAYHFSQGNQRAWSCWRKLYQ